jgi:enoyl-CoA hydratase
MEQNMGNSTFIRTGDDAITVLTLSRPHCLDVEGKHVLIEAVNSLIKNMTLRVVIIAASHPQAWLVNVAELSQMSPAEARKFSQAGHKLADALVSLPVPVIAAVDGSALGGGCELVLACDIAIAGTMARFGQIEAMGGVLPAFGGTWRLALRVGYQRAMPMLFTAEVVDAQTAKSIGLVLDVVPSSELLDRARGLGAQISKVSRQSVAALKRVVAASTNLAPSAISVLEEETFASLFGTDDQRGRMRAFLASQAAQPMSR